MLPAASAPGARRRAPPRQLQLGRLREPVPQSHSLHQLIPP
uniref:Uncharacterized protein n=1 Tax=Arundo donax TaxID=35708 RepID=A0A0A9AWR9_ARUDO